MRLFILLDFEFPSTSTQVCVSYHASAARVFYIVIDVCESVGVFDNLALQSRRCVVVSVIAYAVAYFKGQVESLAVLFKKFYHSLTLFAVNKAAAY